MERESVSWVFRIAYRQLLLLRVGSDSILLHPPIPRVNEWELALGKEGLSWRENWLRIGAQLCTWLTPRLSLAYSSACQRSLISRRAAFPKTKGVNAILNTQTREKHFELFCWVITALIYIQLVKFRVQDG